MISQYSYRNRINRYGLTSQNVTLKSGFTVFQTKKALSKAWIGYTIAKRKGEDERMKYYASVIHKLQRELLDAGIISEQSLAKFPGIDVGER
jgi:hypothetical protein